MPSCFGITDEQFWSMVEPEEYPCDCRLWLGQWHPNGYGVLSWARTGVLIGRVIKNVAYRVAYNESPYRQWPKYGFHISHLCGLAPCCNPLHLMPISASQNAKDGALHKRILNAIGDDERQAMRSSGMSFKEISRVFDIPPGVAFLVIHGRTERSNYPAPFIDETLLERQPKPWYVEKMPRDDVQYPPPIENIWYWE